MQITTQDIDYEGAADEKLQHFSDAYREGLAVCRKIAEYMPSCDTFLFHASAPLRNEKESGADGSGLKRVSMRQTL